MEPSQGESPRRITSVTSSSTPANVVYLINVKKPNIPPAAARDGVDGGNHALQVLAIGTVESVRMHPLRAIAVAAGGGAAIGLSLGFYSGWFARGRRLRGDSAR